MSWYRYDIAIFRVLRSDKEGSGKMSAGWNLFSKISWAPILHILGHIAFRPFYPPFPQLSSSTSPIELLYKGIVSKTTHYNTHLFPTSIGHCVKANCVWSTLVSVHFFRRKQSTWSQLLQNYINYIKEAFVLVGTFIHASPMQVTS